MITGHGPVLGNVAHATSCWVKWYQHRPWKMDETARPALLPADSDRACWAIEWAGSPSLLAARMGGAWGGGEAGDTDGAGPSGSTRRPQQCTTLTPLWQLLRTRRSQGLLPSEKALQGLCHTRPSWGAGEWLSGQAVLPMAVTQMGRQPGPFLAALAQGRVLEPVDQQQGQEVASVSHVRRFLFSPQDGSWGVSF